MKIAITAEGRPSKAPRPPLRPGRRIFRPQLDTGENAYAPNDQNLSLPQGAGIQSAQTVAGLGVGAVVTGHVGPKPMRRSKKAVSVSSSPSLTVREAIESYKAGKMESADGPDKGGHW
jgi:predicted Fe-Mo cluster-binding NifX family protein